MSHQAIRNFCHVLISQIKGIKRWCRQPSLTQIQQCTAKPLHIAADRCNRQPKAALYIQQLPPELVHDVQMQNIPPPLQTTSQRLLSLAPDFLIPLCYTDSREMGLFLSSGQSLPSHPWIPQFLLISSKK